MELCPRKQGFKDLKEKGGAHKTKAPSGPIRVFIFIFLK